MSDRTQRARSFLEKVAGPDHAEMMLSGSALESMAASSQLMNAEQRLVRGTVEKLATNRELSPPEQFALEAIIIPDKRPAIDIINGDFEIRHPLWQHFAADPIKPRIRSILASVGRVEVFGIPSLPYGGTAFVVGPGLIMTNRHVAELFAAGLGRRDLVFRAGLGSGIDFKRERGIADKQFLRVGRIVMIHPYWDMSLLQVEGLAEQHPSLVLSLDAPTDLAGRDAAVIGYPAFDPRNPADVQNKVFDSVYYVKRLQPGKLGSRRPVESFGHTVSAMTHDASTLGGNSGSCVFDVTTGSIVALHFAGSYLDANFCVPALELAQDQHVIEAGVQFRSAVSGDGNLTREWWRSVERVPTPSAGPRPPSAGAPAVTAPPDAPAIPASAATAAHAAPADSVTWTIPLQITVRVGSPSRDAAEPLGEGEAAPPAPIERMVVPVHDDNYATRKGYATDFLGVSVPLPTAVNADLCAPLADGGHVLDYHHFSLVMHKRRRLAMFTAANVDGTPARKAPDRRRSYSRDALGGLGRNDIEMWFTDSRISKQHQLPDQFFTKDRGAFDRGHIVRREDVAWGDAYEEVQFANGDTFHTTNCSPQVAGFNRPDSTENWGDLEKLVSSQGRGDRLTIFAGPVLAEDDPTFVGTDDAGGTLSVQIPRQYWKVITVEDGGALRSFGFLLRQDLGNVPLEFVVDAAWQRHMIALDALQALLGTVRFPDVVRRADQASTDLGEMLRRFARIGMVPPAQAKAPMPPVSADSATRDLQYRVRAAQRQTSLAYIAEFEREPPTDLPIRAASVLPGIVGIEPVFQNDCRFVRLTVPAVDDASLGISPFDLVDPLRNAVGAVSVEPDLPTDFFPPQPEPGYAEGVTEESLDLGCWVGSTETPPADHAWALRNLRIPEAWALAESQGRPGRGEGILVAQPDTGVTDHPELQGAFDTTRWTDLLDGGDPIDPLVQNDPLDNPGHGTGTGSVVASRGSVDTASTGGPGSVTGSAPAVSLVPIRCIESVSRITQSRVARAIEYAVDSGCHVITMSLGGLWSRSLGVAVERAIDNNLIVLAAAGNCVRLVVWPARFERCIAVAGSNVRDTTWKGSCRGGAVDITAPAQHVWRASRKPDEPDSAAVGAGEGTSFAVALTAGVAAMWLGYHGRQSLIGSLRPGERLQDRFVRLLKRTARTPDGWDAGSYGPGIVDARALLMAGIGDTEAPFEGAASFSSGSPLLGDQATAAWHLLDELSGGMEAVAPADPALLERHGLELIWLALERERRGTRGLTEAVAAPQAMSEVLRRALSRPENLGVARHLGLSDGGEPTVEMPTPNSGDDVDAEPGVAKSMAAGITLEVAPVWRVAASLLILRGQVNARAPHRSKASDGTIGDAAHATRDSDHNPWIMDGAMGVVTALDITHDPAGGCDAGRIAEAIRASRDPRVKYVIWNRQIMSSSVAPWTWRSYTGANPHTKHVHISVLSDKAHYNSTAAWAI